MFELQGDLGALLREETVGEGVGKLVLLSDAHQELRLRAEALALHTGPVAGSGQRGEIDVRGEVLLTGSLIRIAAGGMMAVSHERAAAAASELLVAGVTVVNDKQQAAMDGGANLLCPCL